MTEWRTAAWVGHSDSLVSPDESDKALPQPVWSKSPFSSDGNCVEIASFADRILIRNSRAQHGPALVFTLSEWTAFRAGIIEGAFDQF